MSTTIKTVTTFAFTSVQGATTYNLAIPAQTQAEACDTVIKHLSAIIEEVKAMAKPGAN